MITSIIDQNSSLIFLRLWTNVMDNVRWDTR